MNFKRREILLAGAGTVLAGCGRTTPVVVPGFSGPDNEPPTPPDAIWEEDDDVNIFNDPMVLFAETDIQPGASGAPQVPALANPHGLPMEILEIRFRAYPLIKTADDYITTVGQTLSVKMDLGKASVSDDKVPLSTFGTVADTFEGLNPQYSQANLPAASNPVVTAAGYAWRLKYPLYVPVGSVLVPKFASNVNAFPTRVEVAYVCRSVQQKPAGSKVMVPWVAAYNSKAFTQLTEEPASNDVSNQLDIVNPFSVPLELARLGGRVMFVQNDVGAQSNFILEESLQFRNRLTKLRLRSSRGDDIVRGPAPFDLVFPRNWRGWDVPGSWLLRPGEVYRATLETDAMDFSTAGAAGNNASAGRIQFAIAMMGYRQVSVESLVGGA